MSGGRPASDGEVVGAVDGRTVVDVMGTGDDHGADRRLGEARQLGGRPLDRAAGLRVRVEEVAGDQDEVHLLGEGQVDGRPEGRELPLALCRRLFAEIGVAGPEVDIGRVEEAQHRGHCDKSGGGRRGLTRGAPRPTWIAGAPGRERRPSTTVGEPGGILNPRNRCAPREVQLHVTRVARHQASSASPPSRRDGGPLGTAVGREPRDLEEQHLDLHRSHPHLRRLRPDVHAYRGRPGVLRPEELHVGSQALPELSGEPAPVARRRVGRSQHRRPTRLRARRRPVDREYFAVTCSRCGNNAQVPFKPRLDKPVYCSDCFRAVKAG